MNATQRAKKRKRAELFRQERERMQSLAPSDHNAIRHASKTVNSKASAKQGKLANKAVREGERWESGFKGDGIATGKDSEGRFRVTDVPFRMSAPAWMRRGVR